MDHISEIKMMLLTEFFQHMNKMHRKYQRSATAVEPWPIYIHSTSDEMQARLVTGHVEIELPYEVLLLQCFEIPTRLRFGRSLQKSGFLDSGNDGCERRDDHVQYRISPSLSLIRAIKW